MLASRKPLSNRDLDRLERVITRDLQSEPRPQYPPCRVEDFEPEQRAIYDAMDAELQEIVRLTMDLLSDIKPADRKLVLRALDRSATLKRAEREAAIAEQDDIEEDVIQSLPPRKPATECNPWDDILNA
jgi:hypothetical protein